jgi:hypothetical protein
MMNGRVIGIIQAISGGIDMFFPELQFSYLRTASEGLELKIFVRGIFLDNQMGRRLEANAPINCERA